MRAGVHWQDGSDRAWSKFQGNDRRNLRASIDIDGQRPAPAEVPVATKAVDQTPKDGWTRTGDAHEAAATFEETQQAHRPRLGQSRRLHALPRVRG